jgi:hypothetical protein
MTGRTMNPPVHPDLFHRLPHIRTIAVSASYVEAYLKLGPHTTRCQALGSPRAQTVRHFRSPSRSRLKVRPKSNSGKK